MDELGLVESLPGGAVTFVGLVPVEQQPVFKAIGDLAEELVT